MSLHYITSPRFFTISYAKKPAISSNCTSYSRAANNTLICELKLGAPLLANVAYTGTLICVVGAPSVNLIYVPYHVTHTTNQPSGAFINHCHAPRSASANSSAEIAGMSQRPCREEAPSYMRGPVRDQPCPIDGHQHCVWSLPSCKSSRLMSTCAWLLLP